MKIKGNSWIKFSDSIIEILLPFLVHLLMFQAVCELLANANVIQELNLSKTECSLDLVIIVFDVMLCHCLNNHWMSLFDGKSNELFDYMHMHLT